jgi:hypothetical protein
LWRNRLCIAVSPERISLLKLGRGLKPKLLGKYDEKISSSGKSPSWQAALEKLSQVLTQPEWQNFETGIVLSNRLVHYAVIPINNQLKKYPEQEAFARHVLTQTYGAMVGQWELRIQRGKQDSPWLVSAVDQTLLEQLRQLCIAHKLKLRSVTPYLMQVFNSYRKGLKADPAWLVVNEPGHSLFALVSGGEFVAVSNVSHGNINELPMLLDRENLVSTLPEPCKTIYLHASADEDLSALSNMGYEFSRPGTSVPSHFPELAEGLYAMALSGAK